MARQMERPRGRRQARTDCWVLGPILPVGCWAQDRISLHYSHRRSMCLLANASALREPVPIHGASKWARGFRCLRAIRRWQADHCRWETMGH